MSTRSRRDVEVVVLAIRARRFRRRPSKCVYVGHRCVQSAFRTPYTSRTCARPRRRFRRRPSKCVLCRSSMRTECVSNAVYVAYVRTPASKVPSTTVEMRFMSVVDAYRARFERRIRATIATIARAREREREGGGKRRLTTHHSTVDRRRRRRRRRRRALSTDVSCDGSYRHTTSSSTTAFHAHSSIDRAIARAR